MNGDNSTANTANATNDPDANAAGHERRLTRVEVGVEYLAKRLDDMERRMDAGFQGVRNEINERCQELRRETDARVRELRCDMDTGFRDQRRGMSWLVGFSSGILLAIQLATLGLLLRGQGLL